MVRLTTRHGVNISTKTDRVLSEQLASEAAQTRSKGVFPSFVAIDFDAPATTRAWKEIRAENSKVDDAPWRSVSVRHTMLDEAVSICLRWRRRRLPREPIEPEENRSRRADEDKLDIC